jgi:hypothetical protein
MDHPFSQSVPAHHGSLIQHVVTYILRILTGISKRSYLFPSVALTKFGALAYLYSVSDS